MFPIINILPPFLNYRIMIVIIALDCDDDQFCVLLKNVLRGNLFSKVFRVTLSLVEEGTIVFSRVC